MTKSNAETKTNNFVIAVVVAILIVAVMLITTFLLTGVGKKSSTDPNYIDPTTGLNVSYSSDIELKSNVPPLQGVIFNMTKSDPRLQITAWYETGDAVIKSNPDNIMLNQAQLDSFTAQLEKNYPGAKVVNKTVGTINDFPSAQLTFDYKTKSGIEMRQRVVMVVKNSDTVVRIAMLAERKDFDSLNEQYLNQISESLKF